MDERQVKINKKLQENLLPGEQVCWQGIAKAFRLLENDNRGSVLGKWIASVIIAGAFCTLSLSKGGQNSGTVVTIVLIIALCVILSPIVEWSSLLRYRYWITDQRAILRNTSGEFHAMKLEEIDAFQVIHGKTVGDCLVLGSRIMKNAEKQMRWQATHPRVSDKDGVSNPNLGVGLVFYSLENADEAAECLVGKVMEII